MLSLPASDRRLVAPSVRRRMLPSCLRILERIGATAGVCWTVLYVRTKKCLADRRGVDVGRHAVLRRLCRCELRPTYDLGSNDCCVRYLWATECGKGFGTALLRKLTKAADRSSRSLLLEVQPFWKKADGHGWCFDRIREGGLSQGQLEAWYQRHGFEKLGGKLMVRNARPLVDPAGGTESMSVPRFFRDAELFT